MMGMTSSESGRGTDGYLSGLAVGKVTENKDPEGLGRVLIRLPWHQDSDTTYWARLSNPMAGGERGTYFVPEVDDEVLVGFANGDPSHTYVLGGLWSQTQPPPGNNEDGKNNDRLIRTRSGHELRFSDDDSAPEAELSLADGRKLLLDQDTVQLDDGSGNSVTMKSDGTVEISATNELVLSAPRITIDGTAEVTVSSNGPLNLKGLPVNINT